jgi:hypothetical protein
MAATRRALLEARGGFHKIFENVERSGLNAVAEQEFLAARKFFHGGNEPEQKLEMRFERGTGRARAVRHGMTSRIFLDQGLRPWTPSGRLIDLDFSLYNEVKN